MYLGSTQEAGLTVLKEIWPLDTKTTCSQHLNATAATGKQENLHKHVELVSKWENQEKGYTAMSACDKS